jgi:hypothetical protein
MELPYVSLPIASGPSTIHPQLSATGVEPSGAATALGSFLTGERVILAADVVGDLRLIGRDETGTLSKLAECGGTLGEGRGHHVQSDRRNDRCLRQ